MRLSIHSCFVYTYPLIFFTFAFVSTMLCPQQSRAQSSEDVSQIKELIDAYANARDENNEDKIRQLFTNEADQLVSSGEWRYGIDALVEGMMRSSQNNPGDRTLTVEKVRFIGLETAIADARYEIKGSEGSADRKMWSTFVVLKEDNGRWKLAAIRNMLPSPPR